MNYKHDEHLKISITT